MDFSEIKNVFDGKGIGEVHEGMVDRQWIDKKKFFKPVLRRNITYVVAAVLFDDEGKVLLTQEGFHPHCGHWYLPAGRVDPGETLVDAARREVREETGVESELTALLSVESPSPAWYRFTFTGRVTGGKLRTLKEQDSETMQGAYWPVETVMDAERNVGDPQKNFILRGRDILKLIKLGVKYNKSEVKPYMCMLPCNIAQRNMLIRPLFLCCPVSQNSENEDIYVLSMDKQSNSVQLPLLEYDPRLLTGVDACRSFYQDIAKGGTPQANGILAIEHNGETPKVTGAGDFHDGLLLTVLVKVLTAEERTPSIGNGCKWIQVTDPNLKDKLVKTYNERDGYGPVPFLY